jgi:SAM-dependent methyltransferase
MSLDKVKSAAFVQKMIPYIPQSLRDIVRFVDARIAYDSTQYEQTKEAFARRDSRVAVKHDIELLRKLHRIFPIPQRGQYSYDDYMSHVKSATVFLDIMKRYIPLHGKDLLDVGTGYGGSLVLRDKYGLKSTTGVDGASTKMRFEKMCNMLKLKESKSMQYLPAATGDFLDVGFGDRQYDIIMSCSCFEHFRYPEKVFKKCLDLLRPGGHMVFLFGPLFRAPYGAHRFRYTGIPYFQNLFSDELVYRFFKDELNVLDEFRDHNNYERDEKAGDPYSEMNRWRASQFEDMFTQNDQARIVKLVRIKDVQFWWFRKVASKFMMNCPSYDDLTVDSILILLQKN